MEEALASAVVRDVAGIPARVFTAEHLAAIALQTGRAKDKTRLLQFIEAGALATSEFQTILESKRAFRQRLAARPIAEKLALLDELRARSLALRPAHETTDGPTNLREESPAYRTDNR